MMGKTNLELWESTKYVSWPFSHDNPIVRVPRPSGQPESMSIKRIAGESEEATFLRCLQYRDKRGVEIWGEKRWQELLKVRARSVARHRDGPAEHHTGVNHYERGNGAPVWIASWYELKSDGTRRKRCKEFSYGTPKARFSTSEQAKDAAIRRRNLEEARWYSTNGIGEERKVNHLYE